MSLGSGCCSMRTVLTTRKKTRKRMMMSH